MASSRLRLQLESAGADGVATANLDDALAVRRSGFSLPILMYGSALPGGLDVLVANGLTPSVWSRDALEAISRLAAELDRTIAVHVKVDAGLGRLGVRLDEAAAFVADVLAAPGVHLEGTLHPPRVQRRRGRGVVDGGVWPRSRGSCARWRPSTASRSSSRRPPRAPS